jgi:ATP-dependent Clp protease ATP-binding subunit ClpA
MSKLGFSDNGEKGVKVKEDDFRARVKEAIRETFRPEFLNRLDEIIIFQPLHRSEIEKIVDIQLAKIVKRLKERNIKIVVDPAARQYIIENGFDAEYGARPIKRLIQKVILDQLADQLIKGSVKDGSKVKVGLAKSNITVNV